MAQDEGRFGRISRPNRCWAPAGTRPLAPAQIVREAVYVFAAVAPALGKVCSLILPAANTEMMNLFYCMSARPFQSISLSCKLIRQAGTTQKR